MSNVEKKVESLIVGFVIWNGGNLEWKGTKVHRYNGYHGLSPVKSLCGLKVVGNYETDIDPDLPHCRNCIRIQKIMMKKILPERKGLSLR